MNEAMGFEPPASGGMDFGSALSALKLGQKVMRAGWNGKGMWLECRSGASWEETVGVGYKALPFIAMKTADGGYVPWLASQTDMLAEDWEIA